MIASSQHQRIYQLWARMKHRCSGRSNAKTNRGYFKRGIRVCAEWQNFEAFKAWAEANGYSPDLWIDRIDGDKGYSPDNCRFVTPQVSAINRRTVRYQNKGVKFRGVHPEAACKGKPYRSEVRFNGKRRFLGRFKTPLAAALAYDEAAVEMHGEFAMLNFPERFNPSPK